MTEENLWSFFTTNQRYLYAIEYFNDAEALK